MKSSIRKRYSSGILTKITIILFLLFAYSSYSQIYTHPTAGLQGSYNGGCVETTCSGTFYDNGGSGSDYSANVNGVYRTFCPNAVGTCVRATFTNFSMDDIWNQCNGPGMCCDYLQILNGASQNSASLYYNCETSPGTITSTDASGCLTFRFTSDDTEQHSGWAATLSCVACAGGPTVNNSDCDNATIICGNVTATDVSTGPGIVGEGCSGCNTSELYPNWYKFKIASSGTLAFTVDPNVNTHNFDLMLYGPNVTSSTLGTPLRCSAATVSGTGNTGMGNGATDITEMLSGDQWVRQLNVTAGQTYYLLINGTTAAAGTSGYQLTFTGSCGLDCALPISLTSFEVQYVNEMIDLNWSVDGGVENDYYILEKNIDGIWVELITYNSIAGNTYYLFTDTRPLRGSNMYRVKIVDRNAEVEYSSIKTVNTEEQFVFKVFPNPASDEVTIELLDENEVHYPLFITNLMGQQILDVPGKSSSGLYSVSLQELNAGLYYVHYGVEVRTLLKK